MPLKRLLIVDSLIAEDLSDGLQFVAITTQPVPIVVSDLMTEVTEQRAVRLMHRAAALLALDIVSFVQSERNESVFVPGHHLRTARLAGCQEVKNEFLARHAIGWGRAEAHV